MAAPLAEVLGAFGLVFVAELGDRTQIALFALALRHPRLPLLLGAATAFAAHVAIAVVLGDLLGARLPTTWVLWGGAGLFVLFGILALREARKEAQEDVQEVAQVDERDRSDDADTASPAPPAARAHGAFASAFLFVLVGELGDKTQIATATLAAAGSAPVATFVGAFLALVASAVLALVLGRWVAGRLPRRIVHRVAAGAFFVAALVMVALALW